MPKPRILIVEDESIVALDLQSSLEALGYEVPLAVSSGEEAIDKAETTKPDLVLMDIMLGGALDGVTAAAAIRERFNIPVVYLTAYADEDTVRRARITEPYGYLLKPFEERELHIAIEIALYKREAEETLRRRDAILEAVGFAAEQFLMTARWQDAIEGVLDRLGQAMDANRISVFQNLGAIGTTETVSTHPRYAWQSSAGLRAKERTELEPNALASSWEERLRQGQVIQGHVRDLPATERQGLVQQGTKSLLAVPILIGQTWWGYIQFDECRSERQWSAPETDALKAAASILAAAIQRTRLDRRVRQRAQQIKTLYSVTTSAMTSIRLAEVIDEAAAALQATISADSVAILLVEPGTTELVLRASAGQDVDPSVLRRALAAGLPRRVLQTGKPLHLADVRPHPDLVTLDPHAVSVLCVALQTGQRIIGAVNLESRRQGAFGKGEQHLVSILAGHLAAVIQNAHLFEETEHLRAFNEGIVQGIAEAILLENSEGIVSFANPAAEELLGYSPDEFSGLQSSVLLPEDEREAVDRERAKWRKGIGSRLETVLLDKAGRRIPVLASVRPLSKDGSFAGILAAFSDIRQYKAAEERRRRYEFIVNTSQDFMALIGRDYTYQAVNDSYCDAHQKTREDILSKTVTQIWGEKPFHAVIREHLDRCFAGEMAHYQAWFTFSTLGRRYMDVTYYPYRSHAGRVTHAVVVSRDVTERQRAKEAEQELMQMKDGFVANVSHELRTPLSSISGYLELLRKGKVADSATQEEFLTRASQDAKRLTALVEDLLDIARLEAGRMPLELTEVNMSSFVSETLQSLRDLAAQRGVSLVEHAAQPALLVSADRRRLEQVLINLVGNAIRFSDPQRAILVAVEAQNSLVTVTVQDRGPGIPAEALPRLFTKFYQADTSRKRAGGGAGLGLYISKQIVECHGGSIGVESTEGEGSTFHFSLPRLRDHDAST